MFSDLRANPEVLWGALIAFGIVILIAGIVGLRAVSKLA